MKTELISTVGEAHVQKGGWSRYLMKPVERRVLADGDGCPKCEKRRLLLTKDDAQNVSYVTLRDQTRIFVDGRTTRSHTLRIYEGQTR